MKWDDALLPVGCSEDGTNAACYWDERTGEINLLVVTVAQSRGRRGSTKAIGASTQVVSFSSCAFEAELNSGIGIDAQQEVTAVAARILPATGTLQSESNVEALQQPECFALLRSRCCIPNRFAYMKRRQEKWVTGCRGAAKCLNASLAISPKKEWISQMLDSWLRNSDVHRAARERRSVRKTTVHCPHRQLILFAACFQAEQIQAIYSSCRVSYTLHSNSIQPANSS